MDAGWRGDGHRLVEGLPQQDQRVSGLSGPPSSQPEESERAKDRYYGDGASLSPRSVSWNRSWRGTAATSSEREAPPWTGTSDHYTRQRGSAVASTSASTYAQQQQPGRWGADPESDAKSGLRLPPIFLQSRQGSPGQLVLPHRTATGEYRESWATLGLPLPPTLVSFGPGMCDEGHARARGFETARHWDVRESRLAMPGEQSLKRK